jgi:hypothetical protein
MKGHSPKEMTTSDYIGLAGVFATISGVLVTWLVMKRQIATKRLSYSMEIEPLLLKKDADLARELKVIYRGEELPEPALLSFEIANVGLAAVENARVIIKLPDATYLIPGYFQDIPAGYDSLWEIVRTDAEECEVRFKHINPKQVARIRFLMDEIPKGELSVSCPMPNVELIKSSKIQIGSLAEFVIEAISPAAMSLIRQAQKR